MLNIGGELAFILQDIDYKSKPDLLEKLRGLRDSLRNYPEDQRKTLRPILSVAIQQAFYASEWELLRYKNFCDYRSQNGRDKEN
ncbi:MAG: hypothetical protein SPL07_06685 [Bacteroidales bacterium]|nr:hypothetical protein [Bacteroidales bacterium]